MSIKHVIITALFFSSLESTFSMSYYAKNFTFDIETKPPLSTKNIELDQSSILSNFFAVEIIPFTLELSLRSQYDAELRDPILRDIIEEYLQSEYKKEFDNIDHVSLNILEGKDMLQQMEENQTSIIKMMSGSAFFYSRQIPTKEELADLTELCLEENSLESFFTNYAESTDWLRFVNNITLPNSEGTQEIYAVSPTFSFNERKNVTKRNVFTTVTTLCAAAGVLSIFAASAFLLMRARKKEIEFKNSNRSFNSKERRNMTIPEIKQNDEMSEGGTLNGLNVIDNVSVLSEKYLPSLAYSHSIAGLSESDNVSDVSVEDEYCLRYERADSKRRAENFKSIWNLGQNEETLECSGDSIEVHIS